MSERLWMADLFSGTGSASEPFLRRGWDVERVDIMDGKDVRDWIPSEKFAFVWASPPCESFSVASFGTHWAGGKKAYVPATKQAEDAIDLVRITLDKIRACSPAFWTVENPRGMLRKIIGAPTIGTTWWCQWGDERAKPTDLWGRIPDSMLPLPTCKNGNPDHASAPRGAKTGTQGRKGLDRARIPERFARTLAIEIEKTLLFPEP